MLGHHLEIGASIGVVLAPEQGISAKQLMTNVDQALYRAKSNGRSCVVLFKAAPVASKERRAKVITN